MQLEHNNNGVEIMGEVNGNNLNGTERFDQSY